MTDLKLEPYSGVSGDMFLGALVALGGDKEALRALPAKLGLRDATITLRDVERRGIAAIKVDIESPPAHHHRHLSDILQMIDGAGLPAPVQALAARIFRELGEAEAAVHRVPLETVHFHEVGAVDSILDIVGSALLLVGLDVTRVHCGPVCTGFGTVRCEHGELPVPAPATEILLRGMPTYPGTVGKEMTTPTGAAILRALKPSFAGRPLVTLRAGYGAGTRDLPQSNTLRASLVTASMGTCDGYDRDEVTVVATNLDNMSGEQLGGYFQEKLFQAGALDVSLVPLLMKKGRPGVKLEVLCGEESRGKVTDLILNETTTLGVRYYPVQRSLLRREMVQVATRFGQVSLKAALLPAGRKRYAPEFEDCRRLAEQHGVSVDEVMQEALRAIPSKADRGP